MCLDDTVCPSHRQSLILMTSPNLKRAHDGTETHYVRTSVSSLFHGMKRRRPTKSFLFFFFFSYRIPPSIGGTRCTPVAVLDDSRSSRVPCFTPIHSCISVALRQSFRLSVHDRATSRRTRRTNRRRLRPSLSLRVSDKRNIGDPERKQQRGQPDPERVRQLRRRIPGRR